MLGAVFGEANMGPSAVPLGGVFDELCVGNDTDILEICYTWTLCARGDELMVS